MINLLQTNAVAPVPEWVEQIVRLMAQLAGVRNYVKSCVLPFWERGCGWGHSAPHRKNAFWLAALPL